MDLISRQAAIDALARTAKEKFNLSDEFNHYLAGLMDGELAIRQLPSAQPEHECRTCRYNRLEWSEEPCDSCTSGGESNHWKPKEPERKWIPCSEPPENEKNVFIAHGTKDFMACCIGHYDHDSGLWYEDRNWFARPIFDGMYWCEMPMLPETEG